MKRTAQILLGLCLGLALVEALAWWRDDGAFPHANFYVPDAKLGVRLRPHATERFRLGTNPPSSIAINSDGLRGRELPEPSANEILVLGDSQVFGLGVNGYETFSYVLAKLTDRPVVNAGVPTYGPLEYNALAAELIAKREPKLVIYTVNMLNDLFESERPNSERHRVWDGWAVRAETAPKSIFEFPGRTQLFSQSHALYALRRYMHDVSQERASYASEGAWTDLVDTGERRAKARAQHEADVEQHNVEVAKLDAELEQAAEKVWRDNRVSQAQGLRALADEQGIFARAHPGDIVRDFDGESSRSIAITAEIVRQATEQRRRALEELAVLERENKRVLASEIKTRDDLKLRRKALVAKYKVPNRPTSVLEPRLRELRKLCDASGCEVLVVALPIDVQVSAEEWKKYGHAPIDMSATTALTEDLLSTANALGMRTLDALPVLRRVEPGAFLDRDIHMTAKGHYALARMIKETLKKPAPTRQPEPGLPPGRTYAPWLDHPEFSLEVPIENADDTGCTATTQDEWIVIGCMEDVERSVQPRFTFARAIAGGHGEVVVTRNSWTRDILAPVLAGEELKIEMEWRRDGAPEAQRREHAVLIATRAKATDLPVLRLTERTYSPWDDAAQRRQGTSPSSSVQWPQYWIACGDGYVIGNALGDCLPLCGPKRHCDSGICDTWQGVDVCRRGP